MVKQCVMWQQNLRLELLQKELKTWDPNSPPLKTAEELEKVFRLDQETIYKAARSEGFELDQGSPQIFEVGQVETMRVPSRSLTKEIPQGTCIGRYQILGKIGEGGMGVVYVAKDPSLDRKIAIKIIRKNVSNQGDESPDVVSRRFLREAQAMAQVSSHENIVTIFDVGTYSDRVFLAMEYIQGSTINVHIQNNLMSWEDIRDLYVHAAKGLIAAHDAGLVHRDFKPDNVLVDSNGCVKVMDFGLARKEGTESQKATMYTKMDMKRPMLGSGLTITGQIMGTPAYMAPEQFMMESVDARADQFAFCVSLYEALAGFRPFQAMDYNDLARNVLNERVVYPPDDSKVPEWIWEALRQGIRKKSTDRWSTMRDLVEALEEPPPHIQAQKSQRNSRILTAFVGLVFAVAGALWATTRPSEKDLFPPAADRPVPHDIDINVRGSIEPEQVHMAIMASSKIVDDCHKIARAEKPEFVGRVEVTFVLTGSGTIREAKIAHNTTEELRLGNCVLASSMFWDFPRPKIVPIVKISYPFVFLPGGPGSG